ncbi:2-oxoacid:acceptor oxidoreductase family protein [Candidatus Omnitrophota bacterium]
MQERIIAAGAGGQGIMLLGKVLADAAMREDKFVTWFPSYGAEVRGGTAHCMVIVSDTKISSPYIEKADSLIIMNQPSLQRFKGRLKDNGLTVINSSLVADCPDKEPAIVQAPFTDIASKLGNIKVANMVAVGAYLARKQLVKTETVFEVFEAMAPKKELIGINKRAIEEGSKVI